MPIDQAVDAAPVVVTAPRLPEAAGDPAFSIVRIDPTVLAVSPRLDEALSSAPGFSLFRRTSSLGANPTTQGVSLRGIAGSGASRALVTLDGVPQNDPFGGWVIWTGLPTETISSATLVRGAGSGPYGAGALTGVVALQQPDHIDDHAIADVSGGDHAYARASAIGEIDAGAARLFLSGSDETSGGWIPVRAGRGTADKPLTLRDWSAAERALVPLGQTLLSERVAAFEEDRGAGTVFAVSRARGVQASLSLANPGAASGLGWQAQAWVEGSDLANSTASVAAGRNSATLANNQYSTPAIGVGMNAALRRSAARYSWELGVDVRDFSGESKEQLYSLGKPSGARISGGGELVAGAYAEASRTFGRLLLTGGVRLDDWETYDSKLVQTGSTPLGQHPGDRGGLVPTGRLGLREDINDALYLRAAGYAGFRPASLNELHRSFRVGNDITLANSALTPERLYGAETGLGGQIGHGAFTWDADVFYNQLANAIVNATVGHGPGSFPAFPLAGFVPAGGTLFERENAGTVNAYGVEGEADLKAGPTFDLRGAFTYTNAKLGRLRPAETPTTTVTAGAAWRPIARLTLTAELRYESDRFDDDQNTRRIAAGTGVDARAEWRIADALSAYVAADNLFDAAIQTGRSAANVVTYDAPRMVRFGLSWRR